MLMIYDMKMNDCQMKVLTLNLGWIWTMKLILFSITRTPFLIFCFLLFLSTKKIVISWNTATSYNSKLDVVYIYVYIFNSGRIVTGVCK